MKYAVWICVALLLVLHQDYWQWDNATLDFGFMPRTLTYHAIISMIAALLWLLATLFCWPQNLPGSASSTSPESDESTEESVS